MKSNFYPKLLFLLLLFPYCLISGGNVAPCFDSIKKENLVVLTIPKSGTHMIQKTLRLMSLKCGSFKKEIENNEDSLTTLPFPLRNSPLATNLDFFLLQHLVPGRERHFSKNAKFILLIRDPRDLLVSQVHHMDRLPWPGAPNLNRILFKQASLEERLCWVMDFPFDIFPVKKYIGIKEYCEDARKWMGLPNVFVLRFEDLVGPEGGGDFYVQLETLQKLAEFIGIPLSDEDISYVAQHIFGDTNTFRKGKIGSWKECFLPEHKLLFKEKMGDLLIEWGYEKDFSW